jgi:hypothetical protein
MGLLYTTTWPFSKELLLTEYRHRLVTSYKYVAFQHEANPDGTQVLAIYEGLGHSSTWSFSTKLILTEHRYWPFTRA